MGLNQSHAVVITVSDGVSAGVREDTSGESLESVLGQRGFTVERVLVPDEADQVAEAISEAAGDAGLILTTGGTGFGPRDVTPEATLSVLDREAPGLVHMMMSKGIENTRMAALSRARAGEASGSLVINLPGSPKGARESLDAVIDLIPHAIQLLSGDTEHH